MHQNTYNHSESELFYKRYVLNIAYRYKFTVHEENDTIYMMENGISIKLSDSEEVARNTLWYSAWMKLQNQYDYNGLTKGN